MTAESVFAAVAVAAVAVAAVVNATVPEPYMVRCMLFCQ